MWLAIATTDGHCMVSEIDELEVIFLPDGWHARRRSPRIWEFKNWSGSGYAAIGYTRAQAIETAYSGFQKRVA